MIPSYGVWQQHALTITVNVVLCSQETLWTDNVLWSLCLSCRRSWWCWREAGTDVADPSSRFPPARGGSVPSRKTIGACCSTSCPFPSEFHHSTLCMCVCASVDSPFQGPSGALGFVSIFHPWASMPCVSRGKPIVGLLLHATSLDLDFLENYSEIDQSKLYFM